MRVRTQRKEQPHSCKVSGVPNFATAVARDVADVLLESLRDAPVAEIEAAWDLEIEKRIAAFDRSELATFSAEEVFAEARRLAR